MSDKITLKKGGKLIETYWHYDKEKEKGSYLERDLTNHMFLPTHILYERYFFFEKGLTLKDVFLYMNRNLDYWNMLLGNWCEELVKEGLKPPPFTKNNDLEYLELYWGDCADIFEGKQTFQRHSYMCFGAKGKPDEQCIKDFGNNPNELISYSLMFSSASELAQHEIKINTEYIVWESNYDAKPTMSNKKVVEGYECIPTVFEALYGIVWELSFAGPPEKRDKEASKLKQTMKEIEDGTAKLVSADEVLKDIEEKND